jgi:hypothetical protein
MKIYHLMHFSITIWAFVSFIMAENVFKECGSRAYKCTETMKNIRSS